MLPPIRTAALSVALLSAGPAAALQEGGRVLPVVRPERADRSQTVPLVGTVEPLQAVTVVPRVTGYLTRLPVDVGDVLEAGDLVAEIDAPDLAALHAKARAEEQQALAGVVQAQAQVADAQAMVADRTQGVAVSEGRVVQRRAELEVCAAEAHVVELELARQRGLLERKAVTPAAFEEAEGRVAVAHARGSAAQASVSIAEAEVEASKARLAAAQAAVRTAQARVTAARAAADTAAAEVQRAAALHSFTRLLCPFPQAVVTRRLLHPGAHVEADMSPVAVLMDVSQVRVVFQVAERDAALVRPGASVTIRFESRSVTPLTAAVTRTAGALDVSTRTLRAEVQLDNPERRLLPGMFCHGQLTLRESRAALILPGGAIHTGPGEDGERRIFVWVVEAGKARRVEVSLGLDDGRVVEITSGLSGTEQVVSGNVSGLREGDRVRATEGDGH